MLFATRPAAAANPKPPIVEIENVSPAILSPANGQQVQVTISGTIKNYPSSRTGTYFVHDKYGTVQPSGPVTLTSGGKFSFSLALVASVDSSDLSGRRYSITVTTAQSNSSNNISGFGSTTVVVPPSTPQAAPIVWMGVSSPQMVLAPQMQPPIKCPKEQREPSGFCSINAYGGLGVTSDEHSTVFPPGIPSNTCNQSNQSPYLFWVATATNSTGGKLSDIGAVVLSGCVQNDVWSMDFAPNYPKSPVFVPKFGPGCPAPPTGQPQDPTFDLNYAAPGSIVQDPTNSANLLMIYEAVNTCAGVGQATKEQRQNAVGSNAYITVGVATSSDNGKDWATEQTNGRYPGLTPPTLLPVGKPLGTPGKNYDYGEGEPSAFIDDVNPGAQPYLYVVHGYSSDPLGPPLANGQKSDLMLARAQLGSNSQNDQLQFRKWGGQSFDQPGIGGSDFPILPLGALENCGDPSQGRHMGSISYVDQTEQYLLLFVCTSNSDPNPDPTCPLQASGPGAAWFFSTSYDLSDPAQWTAPQEVDCSWSPYTTDTITRTVNGKVKSTSCHSVYNGWYPTLMSLSPQSPGHLPVAPGSGYAFSMWGCQGGGAYRNYTSRTFTISQTPPPPPPHHGPPNPCAPGGSPKLCCAKNNGTWVNGFCQYP